MIKILLAVIGALLLYLTAVGFVSFLSGMIGIPDRNWTPENEEKNQPTASSSNYRKNCWPYNRWWAEQPWQEREIISSDGLRLVAKLLPADVPSDRLAIVVHGYRCCSGEEGYILKMFHEAGYHVLGVEQRAHGASGGRFITMAYRECDDVSLWVREMAKEHPEWKQVLYGASMGAATVINANAMELAPEVRCVVEDCGYTDTFNVFLQKLRKDLSWLPLKKPVVAVSDLFCRLFQGFWYSDRRPIDSVRRARLPMLFIHGQQDRTVPAWMGDRLYEACSSAKEFLKVEEAHHNVSFFEENERYVGSVLGFVDRYMA